MNGETRHFYRFRSFRLNVAERQLLRDGTPIPLTPKAFDILTILVEQSGHLVEKAELMRSVWADSFVEEANIARIIHTLRKTLSEDENGNRFIETVATKGYRFVAEVTRETETIKPTADSGGQAHSDEEDFPDTIDLDIAAGPGSPPIYTEQPTFRAPTRVVFFSVGFVTAVSLILLISFNYWSDAAARPGAVRSIGVLPLIPVSVENREPIFELGIAESLIMKLGMAKGLVVRHLSATRRFTDINQDPLDAGRKLGVDYVLSSTYQLSDGRIRINSQLFNVATQQIEETYKSEKDAGPLFATQDAIADELGKMLLAQLAVSPDSPAVNRGTANEEAYRLYLHGKSLAIQRDDIAAEKAIESLEQAVALDPNFAQAYARLGYAYYVMGGVWRGNSAMADRAKVSVTKAFELDGDLAEAHAVRGILRFSIEWDFDAAEKDLLRAIELEPGHDLAHWGYAMLACFQGRFDRALTAIETAQTISPGTVIYSRDRGRILYYARRYDESIAQLEKALELDNDAASVWSMLWLGYEAKGDFASAVETRITLMRMNGQTELGEETQKAYEAGGMPAVWRNVLERNKKNEDGADANFYGSARLCIYLGDKDQAFHYLNKTYDHRQFQMALLLVDPVLDPLRDDPRFDELVRRVGLKGLG